MLSDLGLEFVGNKMEEYVNLIELLVINDGPKNDDFYKTIKHVRKKLKKLQNDKWKGVLCPEGTSVYEDMLEQEALSDKAAKT